MRPLSTVRMTLGALAVALAACSAQRAVLPSSGPQQAARTWMDLRAKPKQILYVSDPFLGIVNLYDADRKDGRPIGQIGDFKQPEGLFVDSSKDLWVTNFGGRDVIGYREGSIFPFYEFTDTSGYPNSLCNGQGPQVVVLLRWLDRRDRSRFYRNSHLGSESNADRRAGVRLPGRRSRE